MNTEKTIETLQAACRALSNVCDGARSEDGSGFNGVDTGFGKSLATQAKWSAKQAVAAQKMLRKYAGQLSGFGIEITELPQLTVEAVMEARNATNPPAPRPKSRVILSDCRKFAEFHFPYSYEEKEYVKKELRARFQNGAVSKYWRVSVHDLKPAELERYRTAFHAEVAPELYAELDRIHGAYQESRSLSTAEDADISDIDLTGFGVDLFPFQRAGVKYGYGKTRVLFGDDMGLGKTFQALATLYAAKATHRFIVVCPASVKINWMRAIAKALGHCVKAEIWDAKTGTGKGVNAVIINYDNLVKRGADLKRFDAEAIIFDEGHYLKTYSAQRTKAAAEIAKGIGRVLILTGTPIMNRPKELITLLEMLEVMDEFGGWFSFAKRYCNAHKQQIRVRGGWRTIWNLDGAANLEELNARLREVCMIRRRKVDVLKELPRKIREQVVLEIDNRDEYNRAQENLAAYVAACVAEDEAFLKTLDLLPEDERKAAIRERQIEKAESAERAEQLVFIETAKQIATRGILAEVTEWIRNFLETGEKFLLFVHHAEFIEKLLKEFPNAAKIVSQDDAYARQANIDRFVKDSECRLMIASLKAGGTGIDQLQTVASRLGFLEQDWTPAVHLQAEDRLYRIGQDESVTVTYFIAENTIVEQIQQMLAEKQSICDSALDGAPQVANGSIFNELIDAMVSKAKAK